MDFLTLAKKRCSIRNYLKNKISAEHIEKILEAGRIAPTAANKQPQRVIAVSSDEGLAKIAKGSKTFGAPLIFIICADVNVAWRHPSTGESSYQIDASIVTDHMMLQAASLGLGSVWVCFFDHDVIKREFALPEGIEPVNLLVVGYADGEWRSPDRHTEARKSLYETTFLETLK